MKIYLEQLDEIEAFPLLRSLASSSSEHSLVLTPQEADLIIVLGSFGDRPEILLANPTYLAFPDKCAAYTEHDHFVPLIPGVYASAKRSLHTRVGRVFTFDCISSHGRFGNPFVASNPLSEKKYLFSFQGGSTCILRKRLFNLRFNRPDVLIENTSTYGHWLETPAADQQMRQQRYGETLAASHFVLCPRGTGSSSIRFFEVLRAGIAPVLISDNYVLPPNIEWDKFLVRVRERDIHKLPQILETLQATAVERGRLAREAYLENFAASHAFDRIVSLCARSLAHGGPPESEFRAMQQKILASERRRHKRYAYAKKTFLTLLRLLHIKNPYQMNER
ncbi:MAG: exostosin family protein [Acidobacteriaceae bacterium]